MILIVGYEKYSLGDEVNFYYYIDPSYNSTPNTNRSDGYSVITPKDLHHAMVINEEPAYIY